MSPDPASMSSAPLMSRRCSKASSWSEFVELAGLKATGAVWPLTTVRASRDSLLWLAGLCPLNGTAVTQGDLLCGEPDALHSPLWNGLMGLPNSVVEFDIAMCQVCAPIHLSCHCRVDV